MAGGSGTRLWPASNSSKPKQFLSVADGHTFFDATLERALAVINQTDGRVIIIVGNDHVSHIINAVKKLDNKDRKCLVLIPEPEAKNTAAAIACGTVYAERTTAANRNILVLTSDHVITPLEAFKADAVAACGQQEALTIFGIPPKSPETGYGYIEKAEALSPKSNIFKVASFQEKPDRQKAEQFIDEQSETATVLARAWLSE
jgi:mannose-1-phosphate guanylyltransferase/mannose-1-phosphate guanylyltransferase/mannose-6-phosphate isomerase